MSMQCLFRFCYRRINIQISMSNQTSTQLLQREIEIRIEKNVATITNSKKVHPSKNETKREEKK